MALTDVQQLNTAWEKWTQDLKIHRGTLADYQLDLQKAVEERLGASDMPQVEHYYNQLDIQLNNISHLKHEIQELEKMAGWDIDQHKGEISDVTLAKHDTLADRYESLCHTLKDLETDFKAFLALK